MRERKRERERDDSRMATHLMLGHLFLGLELDAFDPTRHLVLVTRLHKVITTSSRNHKAILLLKQLKVRHGD